MNFRSLAAALSALILASCSADLAGPAPELPMLRIVNSTFQTTDSANTLATAVPRAIDVMLDGSTGSPGAADLAPISVTGEDGSDGYQPFDIGVHSFSAHLAGSAAPNTSLFTDGGDPLAEFSPKLYFTSNTYYTLIIAGVAPTQGLPEQTAFLSNAYGFEIPLVDDHAAPPKVKGEYQSRFRLVNAAPFGAGGQLASSSAYTGLFLTTGETLPTVEDLAPLSALTYTTFRAQSPYVDVAAGKYVVTITTYGGATRTILAQQVVDLAPGDVRTFLLQNTAWAPEQSEANHKLTPLLDAHYDD